jgi:short-subunit dehydrogenase
MAFVYMPWDIFWKPVGQDQEVWFGYTFTGWGAKVTAIPHWFVYGAAVYGFRRHRPWLAPVATFYVVQVAIGMFVWPILQYGGLTGFVLGAIATVPFGFLTMAFWNARQHFLADSQSLRDRYGDWGIVTGASAGLGVEFAWALARDGVNVVLTARREERLASLAVELEQQHGIETRVVAADLAAADGANRVASAVEDLEIGILINNAGIGGAGRFDKIELERVHEIVQVNCVAPAILTHLIVPGMQQRGRGAVIFTGSIAGRQPLPLHSVYAASKAFDLLLGEALWVELAPSGIDVLVLEPGPVETEFWEVAGELSQHGERPEQTVAVALAALGEQPSVISGWLNWLRANLATRLASRPLVAHVAKQVMEVHTPSQMR